MPRNSNVITLSKKERCYLKYIAQGLTSKDIAIKLHRTINTVNTHKKRIIDKLEAKNMNHALILAMQHNLLQLTELLVDEDV